MPLLTPRRQQVQPAVTYTPNGVPREPGFYNPTNFGCG